MRTLLTGGCLYLDGRFKTGLSLLLSDGKIADIVPEGGRYEAAQADLMGRKAVPGFIDIHVHGGCGCDTMDGTPQALDTLSAFFASHGTTSILPTTMTGPVSLIRKSAENVYQYMQGPSKGANILGLHLEGPFLNPSAKGAHPEEYLIPPAISDYRAMTGPSASAVRLVTLAPELPGAMDLSEYLTGQGIVVSIGHTIGGYEQTAHAIGQGLRHACHFYNAMVPLKHREPGTVGAILDHDETTLELIADLIHVHPAALRLAIARKGPDKTALITDAMAAAGLGDGEYALGGLTVYVRGGEARLSDGTLAGSTLTQDKALSNITKCGISLEDGVKMLTAAPARILGIGDHKGHLRAGYDGDITVLDQENGVHSVYVQGRCVHGT